MKKTLLVFAWPAAIAWVAAMSLLSSSAFAAPPAKRPINLLFIMTDQQRFDALSCAGNAAIKTPNLDRLAHEGVRFEKAYTCCPVCSPARTSILTGKSIDTTKIFNNGDITRTDLPSLVSFDQLLLRSGYHGEYHGKYHSPYSLTLEYTHPVRWLNGKNRPEGSKADMSEAEAIKAYMDANVPERPLQPGEHSANMFGRPYRPDPLDPSYGQGQDKVSQASSYGWLEVPPEYTLTAMTAKLGLEGLERLKDGPFTLTISIGPPHPPMIVAKPYYGMYPPAEMPVSPSISDPRTNSPYLPKSYRDAYHNPQSIQQMTSDYYGMIAEVDDWVGRILQRLDELNLTDHTLVIFTSDHGEMLGDHGMDSKMVFYEGSSHIPLLMRLPGVIPAGTVVKTPVSHIDLFATILDYCGIAAPASQGTSLRGLINGQDQGVGRFVVSEWNADNLPAFMVYDGRWKLLFGRSPEATSLDALYDLQNDPHEVNNLIGSNPDWAKSRGEAERMKGLLVEWLARVQSPYLDSVKARPIALQAAPVPPKKGEHAKSPKPKKAKTKAPRTKIKSSRVRT